MVKEAAVPSTKLGTFSGEAKPQLPTAGNLAVKCPKCKEIIYGRDWEKNLKVCPRCNHHFRLPARERIALLLDPDSFVELDAQMIPVDPLHFAVNLPNATKTQDYANKLIEEREKAGQNEAVISGYGLLDGLPLTLAVMDFHFMGGSMGSVVGEKITRAIESAIERHTPMLIAATSGGARMQEGIFSLMQMAKVSAALAKLGKAGLAYFSLLTDPTTGGVSASFAFQGDIILAEPGALICFTGPRVIEGFMHIKVPENTINSDFALQHGMIDGIVHRRDLRQTLARLLHIYAEPGSTPQ
ncbi:MAG TPA: acetyl-CoA carboxylase, carboxyltransferase subunit beta [Ktedonobacteraceae bacterium]|jgi:acetyl-CoA carboxylase carboxyl transferase subunit beta|nr:acetyl-CoA carboxylase, carboxyltransferase subunit beta [Ktedonobacteraceae bacterium]